MKKLTLSIVTCLFAVATIAGLYVSSLDGSGNTIIPANGAAYFNNVIVPIGPATSVTLGAGFASSGANSSSQILTYDATFDGTHWQLGWFTWTITANGTTPVFTFTNLTSLTNSVASLRLASWTNNGANSIINPLHESYTKPNL